MENNILDAGAEEFITELAGVFHTSLKVLLGARRDRQLQYDSGHLPDFLQETEGIRNSTWEVSPVPEDIHDRRVEITGPPDRKMVINALNSGANVFMADFEDSMSPTWENVLSGQQNLYDAVRGTITYEHPTKGTYRLCSNPAVLFVRPRGLHLPESHFKVGGEDVPACLFDFGIFMYNNARYLVDSGRAPYFYLPKLEHYLEARWWNSVFTWTQEKLGIEPGTIKATVLLETLPAAFQMNEILYELKEHSAGLNCGRWDYIFSYIKTLGGDPSYVLPDRSQVTMESSFMTAYSNLVVHTCHKRGIHAMGGMAAQIPIRDDAAANASAMEKVYQDKRREVAAGHDGTWVAHPGLISIAKDVFNEFMPGKNQISLKTECSCSQSDLLQPSQGTITRQGLQQNVDVGIRYISAWLNGNGCVPLYNLMEDAATAEISRTQIWQWIKHGATLDDGTPVSHGLLEAITGKIVWDNPSLKDGANLFLDMCLNETVVEFLTIPAYKRIMNG